MKRTLLVYASAFLLLGCSSGIDYTETDFTDNRSGNTVYPAFEAGFEKVETKTFVDDGLKIHWDADDRLSIFFQYAINTQYRFKGEQGANAGKFEVVDGPSSATGNELSANYAVYPYNSTTTISDDGTITLTMPEEVFFGDNSFGLNSNTMVAVTKSVSDKFLTFKNVGGFLVLKFYGKGTIASIKLSSRAGEKIAGKADVSIEYGEAPLISLDQELGTENIILNCGDGVTVGESPESATAFWFVIPPVTFTDGFAITLTDIKGAQASFNARNERIVSRNAVTRMSALKIDFSGNEPVVFSENGIDGLDETDFEW